MRNSPNNRRRRRGGWAPGTAAGLFALLLGGLLAGGAAAQAADAPPPHPGAPQRLTPFPTDIAGPSAAGPAKPAGAPAATEDGGVEAAPLAPVSAEWAGPLGPDRGGFPADLWQGTPHALVAALLPRLAPTTSPGLQALTRRLLLSNAAAPADSAAATADPGAAPDLFAPRLARLEAAGEVDAAIALVALAPASATGEGLERTYVELAFLANDTKTGCGRVVEDVRRFQGLWWSRALIACQAVGGEAAKAMLGLDLLREQKAPRDDAFDLLVGAVGGRRARLGRLDDPDPLDVMLLAAAKLPLPETALANATPAVARAWATNATAPPEQRLAAAERAAAFGALPLEELRGLYGAVKVSAAERAQALSRAAAEDGPRGHALLYAAASGQTPGPARAELLQAMMSAARKAGDTVFVARLVAPLMTGLAPSAELAWFAADAVRILVLSGRNDEARAWAAVAKPDAGLALFPLLRLALGPDGPAVEPQRLDAAEAGLLADDRTDGAGRAALALALLAAFDDPVGPENWTRLAEPLPLVSLDLPGPTVWFDLPRAAAGKRVGETVLLALLAAGEGEQLTRAPARLIPAIAALRACGLEREARAIAVEAAIAAGL